MLEIYFSCLEPFEQEMEAGAKDLEAEAGAHQFFLFLFDFKST